MLKLAATYYAATESLLTQGAQELTNRFASIHSDLTSNPPRIQRTPNRPLISTKPPKRPRRMVSNLNEHTLSALKSAQKAIGDCSLRLELNTPAVSDNSAKTYPHLFEYRRKLHTSKIFRDNELDQMVFSN